MNEKEWWNEEKFEKRCDDPKHPNCVEILYNMPKILAEQARRTRAEVREEIDAWRSKEEKADIIIVLGKVLKLPCLKD